MASRLDIDTDSVTWRTIREWATEELAVCRKRNDGLLPMENTASLRGEIVTLKKLLALEIAPPQTDDAFGRPQSRGSNDG